MHKIQFWNALKLRLWKLKQGLKIQYHYYTNTYYKTIHWLRNFALIRASKVYLEHWEVGYGKHDDVSIDGIFLQGGLSEKIEWGIKKESLFYNIFSPVFFSSHHPIINQPNRTTLWYGKKWYSLGKQQSHRQKTCIAVGFNAVLGSHLFFLGFYAKSLGFGKFEKLKFVLFRCSILVDKPGSERVQKPNVF